MNATDTAAALTVCEVENRKPRKWSEFDFHSLLPELAKHFSSPPDEFRPVPWLCFNGKLTREEISRSVRTMYEQKIRSFFIFPIYGLEVEFLSDAWFDAVKFTVSLAAELGMTVWIYDDYNWPCGNCGGKLIIEHPEFNKVGAACDSFEIAPGDSLEKEFPGELIRFSLLENKTLTQIPHELEKNGGKNILRWKNNDNKTRTVLLMYKVPAGSRANWVANKGALWQRDNGLSSEYIDWLNPDAIDCFIELIYQRYYDELKPYWQTTVKGFMTDEPGFFGVNITSHPQFNQEFINTYGYDMNDNYEHLFHFIDDNTYQIRADYFRFAGKILGRNLEKINSWCLEHGVDFTGHFLGEESPGQEVSAQADSWPVRKSMSIPGMDLLRHDSNYSSPPMQNYSFSKHTYSQAGMAITTKAAASTSRRTKSPRCFAEVFGVAPHWVTPADHTLHTHWFSAMGINFINDNTLALSYEDFRKRSLGGKHFTTPWLAWYKDFADFSARCSLFAATGHTPAKIGMVYPMLTAQSTFMRYKPEIVTDCARMFKETNFITQQTADILTKNNYSWELIWEEQLENDEVNMDNLDINVIVIPSMYFCNNKIIEYIAKFSGNGGTVIFTGHLPEFGLDGAVNIKNRIDNILRRNNVHHLQLNILDKWPVISKQLQKLLEPHSDPDFELFTETPNEIIAVHRKAGEYDIFHLVNTTQSPKEIFLDINMDKPLSLWHPDDGLQYSLAANKMPGKQRMHLDFAPMEGYFIVAGLQAPANASQLPPRNFRSYIGFFHSIVLPPEISGVNVKNLLKTLDSTWNFKLEKPNSKPLVPQVLQDAGNQFSGEKLSSEDTVQEWVNTKNNIVPFTLNPEIASHFWIKTVFEADTIPDNLSLVVDGENYSEVYCNGKKLNAPAKTALWNYANLKFDLHGFARPGRNVIVIRSKISDYLHPKVRLYVMVDIVEPIVLTGNFGTLPNRDEVVALGPQPDKIYTGDWALQGFSGYSGTAIYSRKVNLEKNDGQIWLDLGAVSAAAEVYVNGKFAGRRCWPPYHYRIDELIKDGENLLEIKVKNSLHNLFENYMSLTKDKIAQAPSGILGPAIICRI